MITSDLDSHIIEASSTTGAGGGRHEADQRVKQQEPQLIMVNVWTWAWVGCGTRPIRINAHCTWLAVSSRVSHTATGREASHSVCSNATITYQPTSAPDSRSRPVRAAVRNSTPPRIAVHSPCPTGVNKPRRTSVSTSLDADRSQLLVTPPGKRGSRWSRANKQRIQRLTAAERLAPAGLAAVTDAKADGSGTALDAVEELVEPEDLGAALDAEPDARANWDGFPGSTKRAILEWIIAAKRPRRGPAGSLRPPGWLPRASGPTSGANRSPLA